MNILVILGHPRSSSLCAAIAQAYAEGATASGMKVERLDLGSMVFDPDVLMPSPRDQFLEPDLRRARELIAWADHLTFVYPGWWGVGPARLKGFLDRILLPGFAFCERPDGRFEGLLVKKTAHLITTLDMPPWVYRVIYRAPGHNALKRSALGFCGVTTTRILAFGPVKDSDLAQRTAWIERARTLGFSLRDGARTSRARLALKVAAWLKALRLQFYPMSWMGYSVGALGAVAHSGVWNAGLYWIGYACLFLIEAATVFTNELFDYESDRRNRNYGVFTGGSRVLVEGRVEPRELRTGIVIALMAALATAGVLLDSVENRIALSLALATGFVLGIGYTAPPLKLAWRGWGEVTVGFTHSFGVIVAGYLVQEGSWSDPLPWLASLPLFFAVLPAIILSGIPDREADAAAGKRTLVVRLGPDRAMLLALFLAVTAAVAASILRAASPVDHILQGLLPAVLPHAFVLGVAIYLQYRKPNATGRIDGVMVISLAYILWFVAIPLWHLARTANL